MDRDVLVDTIARRLRRPVGAVPPELPPWRPPSDLFIDDPVVRRDLFVARAQEGGSTVELVPDRGALTRAVLAVAGARDWHLVACDLASRRLGLDGLREEPPVSAQFGLCEAEAAVAEVGSVLLMHGERNPRSVSLLPPAAGFIVRASSIVSRLTEALEMVAGRGMDLPPCITFVRGPSRSADIGSTTCFGAHGPGAVWVWVVEGE